MRPSRRVGGDRGESLLELVIAIAILGVCVVAIGTGMALSVKISDIHRGQAIAQQYLHNDAELLSNTGSYVGCTSSTTPNYPALVPLPAPQDGGPWTVAQSDIKFWDATNRKFVTGCPGTGDPGLQQVTLAMKHTNGPVNEVNESLVLVIRSAT